MASATDKTPAAGPAGEIRERILAEHDRLRRLIGAIRSVADLIGEGDEELGDSLRVMLVALFRKLKNHMRYEDETLAPLLRDLDAFGEVRVEAFAREHEDQRQQMTEILQTATNHHADGREVAERAIAISERVLNDIEHEEATFLHPDVLRDDIIVADTETG